MPLLFQSESRKDVESAGFIVPERRAVYGPGVIALFTILGLAFVVYAALFSFRVKVASDIELTKSQTDNLERTRDPKLEMEIFIFEKRIRALSSILRSHVYLSQLLPVIEDLTLPTAYYDSMSASVMSEAGEAASGSSPGESTRASGGEVRVDLQGNVQTLLDLARQIIIFRDDPRIQKGGVAGFSIAKEREGVGDAGGISFNASITLGRKTVAAP